MEQIEATMERSESQSGSSRSHPALTKIIATLGPASSDETTIERLIEAGVSVFRFNFSHGDTDGHAARLQVVRRVADELRRPIAVLGDLPGPKIRVGQLPDEGVDIATGDEVTFHRTDDDARAAQQNAVDGTHHLASRYTYLIDDVQVGHRVLINDGAVRMLAVACDENTLHCTVTNGGLVTTAKGINLPDTDLQIKVIGERDWEFVRWAIENDIDYLALSFVRHADDIDELQAGIATLCRKLGQTHISMPVVAKIEVPQALKNIDGILDAADAIMIARGDLGVEMDLASVPVIQKDLILKARAHAKPCIVATQMLESMIHNPTPTRAEATDVANAIFDGVDAVMMSGETAVGAYPALAVEHMRRIAESTEDYLRTHHREIVLSNQPVEKQYRTAVLARGAATIANDIDAKFIAVWSQKGGGARHLSQLNFLIPIMAISTDERALRQMQLMRSVTPVRMMLPEGLAHFTLMVDAYVQETAWAKKGDNCLLIAGGPIGEQGVTNSLAIHCIGDERGGYAMHNE